MDRMVVKAPQQVATSDWEAQSSRCSQLFGKMRNVSENAHLQPEEKCACCTRPFKLFRRLHRCRFCRNAVCDSCSKDRKPCAITGRLLRSCDCCGRNGPVKTVVAQCGSVACLEPHKFIIPANCTLERLLGAGAQGHAILLRNSVGKRFVLKKLTFGANAASEVVFQQYLNHQHLVGHLAESSRVHASDLYIAQEALDCDMMSV